MLTHFLSLVQSLSSSKQFKKQLLIVVLGLSATQFACSQVPSYNEVGYKPYGSYDGSNIDTVNLDNLNLSLNIPLFTLPQRGRLAFSYSLPYTNWGYQENASCYQVGTHNSCVYRISPATGRYLSPQLDQNVWVSFQNADIGQSAGSGEEYYTMNYTLRDSQGSQHVLLYESGVFRAADGSGWLFKPTGSNGDDPVSTSTSSGNPTGTAFDARGNQYVISSPGSLASIQDADGNVINLSTGYDSLGRSITFNQTTASTSLCPTLSAHYQPVSNATSMTVPGPNNEPVTYTFCYATIYIHTDYLGGLTSGTTDFYDYANTTSVLQSIVLPNGTYWGFVYDSANSSDSTSYAYGDLLQLILPTGGTISYVWRSGSLCTVPTSATTPMPRMLSSRTVNPGDGAASSTWNYTNASLISPKIGTQYTAVVTNPDGSQVVHGFTDVSYVGDCSLYETATQYGTPVNGSMSLTKTVNTQYQPASGYYPTLDAAPLPIQTTTTWPNGQSSYSKIGYDTGYPTTSQICYLQTNDTWYCIVYNNGNVPLGKVISQSDYDFSGSLLRQTATNYQWQTTSSYLSSNLLDTPTQVTISNASGTAAQTNYTYDQAGLIDLTPSPAPPTQGYGTAPDTVFGHVTTKTDWLNVGGSSPVTHTYWLTTGKVDHTVDARGNTTTYTYDSTANFPAKVVHPATGSVTHQEWFSFDPNTGKPLWHTDENGNSADDPAHTTTYSYDSSASLLTETFPDGGGSSINYNDYVNPLTVQTTIKAMPDPSQVSTVVYDGLGRLSTKSVQDSIGTITTATKYDNMDRVASVTNPYRSITDPSYGITLYTYDVLNRKLVQTNPDNSTQNWSYSGSSVTNTDENGNQWTHTSDALGRLTQVLEPNGLSKTPSMVTTYAYDSLNNLVSVAQQGGSNDTARPNRNFNYDSLSRLTCASNFENSYGACPSTVSSSYTAGTTAYAYDSDDNLLTKIFTEPNGGSSAVTLGYCYDNLNRLVGEWGAAPPSGCSTTPTSVTSSLLAAYTYDVSPISEPLNTKGHLTDEKSYLAGIMTDERSPYQFDPNGRLTRDQNLFLANTNSFQFLYGYDVAGNLTCTNNGIANVVMASACTIYTEFPNSITANYTYDQAGRLATETAGSPCGSSQCTPFATTQLYGNTVYGAAGVLSASYGNGLNLTRFYDNRMRVMDNEVFPSTDIFGTATVTISENAQTGDNGTVSVTTGGVTMSASYTPSSTPQTIATALAEVINETQNSPVSASANGAVITLTALQAGTNGDVSVSALSTDAGSSSPTFSVKVNGTVLQNGTGTTAYSYKLQYTANGNISNSQDYYNGSWNYYYDSLNRLTSASSSGATYPFQCWSYDGFGNRWFELDMTSSNHVACPASNASAGSTYAAPTGSQYLWATYAANNQISATGVNSGGTGPFYDNAGNTTWDGVNQYVYDLEGRICAVNNTGLLTMTQYVYDAEGRRVAKGSITGAAASAAFPSTGSGQIPACIAPTTANGFTLSRVYLRGSHGDQDTELDGSYNWLHTNVFAAGGLTATYWNNAGTDTVSYAFSDWLGTKRLQATGTSPSMAELYWRSQEYGNFLTASGNAADATKQHFTGKERDTESGLDYFGARYYGSSMGRMMSPDDFANDTHTSDPQSWNLYAYARNNPLRYIDPTGQIVENTDDQKHKLTQAEMNAISKDLQQKTGLSSVAFDKNGVLGYDKDEVANGGSAGLRDQITSAIDSQSNVFKLGDYSNDPKLNFMDTDSGTTVQNTGVTTYNIRIDFADYANAGGLSDRQAMAAFSLGLGISHEIDHKFPVYNPRDTGPGGVIDNVNVFQRQLGLATRDINVHNISCPSGTCSIPFHDPGGKERTLRWQLENSGR